MEEIEKKLRRDVETADADFPDHRRVVEGFHGKLKDIDLITSNLQEIVDGFAVVRDTLEELPEIIRKNNEAMEALRAPQEPEEFTPERPRSPRGPGSSISWTPREGVGRPGRARVRGRRDVPRRRERLGIPCAETSEPPRLTRDEAFRKFPAFKQQTQALDC